MELFDIHQLKSQKDCFGTMLKLDLHVHSKYSDDAKGSTKDIIKNIKKKGLDGFALTDHNSLKGVKKALKYKDKDFIIIPGVEVSTNEGHLLALNVHENIKKRLPLEETIEEIKSKGGTPVVPHLFRSMSGIKEKNLEKTTDKITSIEVFNACSLPKTNVKTAKIAKKYNLGGTGGSDAHSPEYAGYSYTTLDINSHDIDSIMSEIENKKTWGEGKTMPLTYRRNRMIKSIKQFFKRGMKRV
ncbi:MAG: CehA/McbA family metallohydrolase [Candidatus Thermoplasmatota archaeon]